MGKLNRGKRQYTQCPRTQLCRFMMQFKPSLASTGVLAILALGFVQLGNWQLQRANEKDLRISQFENAGTINDLPAPGAVSEFSEINLVGRYDPKRHVMADNQMLNGRTGVHVYSLFHTETEETILVNRGWMPLPADRTLPVVDPDPGIISIHGHLGSIPAPGRRLGPVDAVYPDRWPQLLTYPDLTAIEKAVNMNIYPWVLFLNATSPGGFEGRNWTPVFMTPAKHRGYAFQWFALAVSCVLAWLFLGFRRGLIQ